MNLVETIAANQKAGTPDKSREFIATKLRELVLEYTPEVIEVLHKCGISVSTVLPPKVILAVVVKHLHKNALLRETITKMLLELDGYYNADGKGFAVIGGALSAVGSILAGIGRGQTQTTDTQLQQQQQQMLMQQQQQQLEQDRKRRTTFVVIGISVVVLVGGFFLIRSLTKSGQPQVVQPQIKPALV